MDGDYTGAVLVRVVVCLWVPWLFYTLHLEVPQVQFIFKDVDSPSWRSGFPMVQTFRLSLIVLPVAVHVVGVPVVQLLQVLQVQF